MTDIRPVDLPEVRADIIEWLKGRDAASLFEQAAAADYYGWLMGQNAGPAEEDGNLFREWEILRLRQCTLFYVAADMVDLARIAAQSIPGFQLAHEDLPAECGLMVFERPVAFTTWSGEPVGVTAVCWAPTPTHSEILLGSIYFDRADALPVLVRHVPNRRVMTEPRLILLQGGGFTWSFGDPVVDIESSDLMATLLPALRATWLLMQQSLATTRDAELPRAFRRRLQRAGHEPRPVRLIELRRPKRTVDSSESAGTRDYHHQWIVRGHWRQQWYPAREVHRPVWIAPHIKGPEDAPLLGGEKVNVWKR